MRRCCRVTNGPAGYLTCPTVFSEPMASCTTELVGFIPVTVNGCHLACHLITGVIGMVAVARRTRATSYALLGGLYYLVWGAVGLVGGPDVRHHLGVDVVGTWVHIAEGALLVVIWLSTRRRSVATAERRRAATASTT
ncbi:protein of unknown function [Amycolatopsis arida]|uniref:DUF4383 domain-containing protein n=1 Tax=Amycolatopsis arida TaxID=587909 RepID=A0A1I6ADA2_9PSEU|nr:uncharacterized protein DUF4383 [Amycolatopsis arida]SFQ66688.1 protein of unknown function [Amycolatopsis arida]